MSYDFLKQGYIRITSKYGWRQNPLKASEREWHKGIDLVKSHKAPIYAFVGGKVAHAKLGISGSGLGNYGYTVVIQDSANVYHVYAHLDSISVSLGQVVKQGQEIGKQGNTGASAGSHLHYEVRLNTSPSYGLGSDTDPTEYLTKWFEKESKQQTKYVPIYANGKRLVDGILINDLTFAQVRSITETYGGKLDWNGKTLKVNGNIVKSAKLINSYNYAHVREIAEILGVKVEWVNNEIKLSK